MNTTIVNTDSSKMAYVKVGRAATQKFKDVTASSYRMYMTWVSLKLGYEDNRLPWTKRVRDELMGILGCTDRSLYRWVAELSKVGIVTLDTTYRDTYTVNNEDVLVGWHTKIKKKKVVKKIDTNDE